MVGNTPNYNDFDVLRTFLLIDSNTSRIDLVKKLELGEGTVRTILDILKKKKLIESTQKGHSLSSRGCKKMEEIQENIEPPIKIKLDLYPKKKKSAILVKTTRPVKNIVELRDVAVKNGADGALIFKYNKGLYLEDKRYEELEKEFNFKENNLLVVAFSDSFRTSENAVIAVSAKLTNSLQKI